MTDECLDIPTDAQATVSESGAVDGIDVDTTTDPVSDNQSVLTRVLNPDVAMHSEHDIPINQPEVIDTRDAGDHTPTPAWSENDNNGRHQQIGGDTQRDTATLDEERKHEQLLDHIAKSPLLTPELSHPGNISVEMSGKVERETTDYHVASDYEPPSSPNYFRCKVNTPASAYTDPRELTPFNERRSLPGRDGAYHRAMTLSGWCPADQRLVRRTPLINLKTPPVGTYSPRYFFVEQKKPTPMQPLKVWRGYQGNVYFEPIHVNRANYLMPEPPSSPILEQYSDTLQQIMKRNKRKHASPPRSITRQSAPRSEAATTPADEIAPSRGGGSVVKGNRKMALLDQDAILDGENEALREDIVWFVGLQSVGSLRVDETAAAKRGPVYQKHRICKGSVAHKIYALRNQEIPLMSLAKSPDASPKLPTPRAPGGSMQTSYNSFPELAVLRSRSRRPGQLNREESGPHDLISARPPPLDHMNFEDGALHFNARPFPGYGLRGRMQVSHTISPRHPQHRVS